MGDHEPSDQGHMASVAQSSGRDAKSSGEASTGDTFLTDNDTVRKWLALLLVLNEVRGLFVVGVFLVGVKW